MRTAVSKFAEDANAGDPCYSIIRTLSSAVHNLSRARQELEESRRALREKEDARKERARLLLQELQPSDKEIANRIFQSLFPDDDESTHQVHRIERQQSLMVRYSLYNEVVALSVCALQVWSVYVLVCAPRVV